MIKKDDGVSFCTEILNKYRKYNALWYSEKMPGVKRRNPSASGNFGEELIRKFLQGYINKDLRLCSGFVYYHDRGKRYISPQADIIVCKPSESQDSYLDVNGIFGLERVKCIIEVKSLGCRNTKESHESSLHWCKGKISCGILWILWTDVIKNNEGPIDLKDDNFCSGIIGRKVSAKAGKPDDIKLPSENDGETLWRPDPNKSICTFLDWFEKLCGDAAAKK